jgi:hypothetical protein
LVFPRPGAYYVAPGKKGTYKPSGVRRRRESTGLPQSKANFPCYEGAIGNAWQYQPRQQLGTIGSVHGSTGRDQIRQNGSGTPDIHGQVSIAPSLQRPHNKDPSDACASTTGTLKRSESLVDGDEQEELAAESNKILQRTGQNLRPM